MKLNQQTLNQLLKNDYTPTGDINHSKETLKEFIQRTDLNPNEINIFQLNKKLKNYGIKPIELQPAIKQPQNTKLYEYRTEFKLNHKVKDLDKSREHLYLANYSENEMYEESLKRQDLQPDFRIIAFNWHLNDDKQTGFVKLISNGQLSNDQLNIASAEIKGQHSDGIGESFEQQEFTNFASFDWLDNDYQLKLVDIYNSCHFIKDPLQDTSQLIMNMDNPQELKKTQKHVLNPKNLIKAKNDLKNYILSDFAEKYNLNNQGMKLILSQVLGQYFFDQESKDLNELDNTDLLQANPFLNDLVKKLNK